MRKKGARHSHIAVLPFGIKSNKLELEARMALVALSHGAATQDHLVAFYVLSSLCAKINDANEPHIYAHAESVERLCESIRDHGYICGNLSATSMTVSVDLLLDWFHRQPNKRIAEVARHEARKALQ